MSQQSVTGLVRSSLADLYPGSCCFRYSASTGVIAAGLAANAILFQMLAGQSDRRQAFIERIRLQYTCLTAFAAPLTAGRSLVIAQPSVFSASAVGGNLVAPFYKGTQGSNILSLYETFTGGSCRIATTGSIGVATAAPARLATLSLAGFGNAGDRLTTEWLFTGDECAPLWGNSLLSRLLWIYAPQTFDAGGTFELVVEVDTNETPRFYSAIDA